MTDRTITLTLPDALYRRAKDMARASALSLEEVVTTSVAVALPNLEDEMPPSIRVALAALPLLTDEELQVVADSMMATDEQNRLEELVELQKKQPLTETEESSLVHLMEQAQLVLLRKAEAYRLLARRGYTPFQNSSNLPSKS
jgi:hypothetical protein